MKICILSQPLHTNYGGLLQAYALQQVLKKLGHEPQTVDFANRLITPPLWRKVASMGKRLAKKAIGKGGIFTPTVEEKRIIAKHTDAFIKQHIATTEEINTVTDLTKLTQQGFECFIVGSDQVWRPRYSPYLPAFFLNFLEDDHNIKKLTYAASFGVDNWEFTQTLTEQCAKLAKKFGAISVREDSGIQLCKQYLGVEAEHVLDPVMLLNKEDFSDLINKDGAEPIDGNLMTYILDQTEEKQEIVAKVANNLKLKPFTVMPAKQFQKVGSKELENCIFPPLTQWLRGFMEAKFVVTDSFHGSVLSIIFNKPFLAVENAGRGMTRFNSLLKLFEIQVRLIKCANDVTNDKITEKIDFFRVNAILNNERSKSVNFLCNILN